MKLKKPEVVSVKIRNVPTVDYSTERWVQLELDVDKATALQLREKGQDVTVIDSDTHGAEITVIMPYYIYNLGNSVTRSWLDMHRAMETLYFSLIRNNIPINVASRVLDGSVCTKVISMNKVSKLETDLKNILGEDFYKKVEESVNKELNK